MCPPAAHTQLKVGENEMVESTRSFQFAFMYKAYNKDATETCDCKLHTLTLPDDIQKLRKTNDKIKYYRLWSESLPSPCPHIS